MQHSWLCGFFLLFLMNCGSDDASASDPTNPNPPVTRYFPPVASDVWETETPESLSWNTGAISPLLQFLSEKHSKSFIVLHNGKIVIEEYFNGHSATTPWYWASAGKTLTSSVTGIAEGEGLLNISDPVSEYLGSGWTSLPANKEILITNRHLMTMTSGLEDLDYADCVSPECLQYVADAGTRWAYHNVYVKLQDVISQASGQSWSSYFNAKLRDPIGMTGSWIQQGDLSVYWSTSRSMARFGLLISNQGKWEDEQIIPAGFMADTTSRSQEINKAYGYLWWLNGQPSYHMPQVQYEFQGSIIPTGPNDMYMALGKNDQKIYIVPSKNLVIIRMGDAADGSNMAISPFDEDLWELISDVID